MLNEFDEKAREWDSNPMHTERAEAIAAGIRERIPLSKNMNVLEFGAGTGLLSFLLKDFVGEITLLDNSAEMVKVAQEKILHREISNMKVLKRDIEKEPLFGSYDLICSQMVFHHVVDIDGTLEQFSNLIRHGGYLAIADLYPEDGTFHGEGFTGHLGFDPDELAARMGKAGFTKPRHHQCYTVNKSFESGSIMQFPVFLLIAEKPV